MRPSLDELQKHLGLAPTAAEAGATPSTTHTVGGPAPRTAMERIADLEAENDLRKREIEALTKRLDRLDPPKHYMHGQVP